MSIPDIELNEEQREQIAQIDLIHRFIDTYGETFGMCDIHSATDIMHHLTEYLCHNAHDSDEDMAEAHTH
nr:hypothetical protein 5 [bacterium]